MAQGIPRILRCDSSSQVAARLVTPQLHVPARQLGASDPLPGAVPDPRFDAAGSPNL